MVTIKPTCNTGIPAVTQASSLSRNEASSLFFGQPRIEEPATWTCPYCNLPNAADHDGPDECFFCRCYVETAFTGYENEIRIKFAQRPETRPAWLPLT